MAKKNTDKTEMVDTKNRVTPQELQKIIKKQMQAILDNPDVAKTLPPICVHGSPGMGKTKIIEDCAKEMGVEFIPVMLAQIEPCDIKGLPVPNHETNTMDWYVNGTWPRDPNSKGILFLDEITAIDRSIAVAAYELILERKLGKLYKLPEKWLIVSAGNLTTDRAVAAPMSSALANRFMHFELENNSENWTKWALTHDIHPSVTGFIQFRPEYLFHMDGEILDRGWPSPRAWERVSSMLHLYGNGHDNEHILRKIVYGLIGNRAGVEFMEFWKLNKKFDDVLVWLTNPDAKIEIPEQQDVKYAIVSCMNYLLWRGVDDKDQNNRINGFFRISMELTPDFASMAMMAAITGNGDKSGEYCAEKIFGHPSYRKWADKFGKSLRKNIDIEV